MSTVGAVVDRLYREFLAPSDRTPVVCTLNGAIDASVTALVVDASMLSVEESYLLSPGVVIEVGLEQLLVEAYDEVTFTATLTRGHAGTAPAAHADNATVTLMPEFARQVAFDAVADEIVALHPLWGQVTITEVANSTSPAEVAADTIGVAGVLWRSSVQSHWQAGRVDFLRNFPPSSTGKAIQFSGVPSGSTTYVTLKKEFTRPTAEEDTLASLFVEDQWVPIVLYGAAARASSYVDPTRLDIDWSIGRDQNEQVPVGSGSVLETRLRRVRDTLHNQALQRMRMEHPPVVRYTHPFNPSSRV
jgi:hypothetical protein